MPPDDRAPGWASLKERVDALPALVEAALAAPARALAIGIDAATRFVVTGVGSSAVHARMLVWRLESLGVAARFVELSAFLERPPDASRDVLVVVSQGLSPNARIALRWCEAFRGTVLLTATTPAGARGAGRDDAAALLEDLARAGADRWTFAAGEHEFGTLVRVTGPMLGYVSVLQLADAVATALGRPAEPVDATAVPERLAAASASVDALVAEVPDLIERVAGPLVFLATGSYGTLVDNLRYKVLEGMLQPLPPLYDVLHLAHGPFQQLYDHPATLMALAREGAVHERALLDRAEAMLVPERHRLVRLAATLPPPLAVLEHEALMNELMLRVIEARGIDQAAWPGRDADGPLYDVSSLDADVPRADTAADATDVLRAVAPPRRLERLTWPEVAGLLATEPVTAVLPLGSTEQHGPHLPFATDTWVATALGERFCATVPESVLLPTLPLGCASEHMAFQGTLDLGADTLRAVLADIVRSLRTHGFARAFIFSAHGGNVAALAEALPALRQMAAPMAVDAHVDLGALTTLWHAASAEEAIAAEVAGHHAGEYETSIVRALDPAAVRSDALAAGHVGPVADARQLFYPSLAAHAPSGIVGDPRPADAARGGRYLDAWAALLVSTYQLEKKSA